MIDAIVDVCAAVCDAVAVGSANATMNAGRTRRRILIPLTFDSTPRLSAP